MDIVNWILKKVGPASSEVSCSGLKEKTDANKLVAAFFGDASSKEHKTFLEIATHGSVSEKYSFLHLNDKECASSHGVSQVPALVVFRKFDQSPITFSGNWDVQTAVDWLTSSSVPTLIDFSEEYIEPIFGQKNSAIFLFRGKNDESSDFAKTFEKAANDLKGSILFIVSGVSDGIQQRLAEFIGIDESQTPAIRILKPSDNMKKFNYAGDVKSITVQSLKSFIDDFNSGKIQASLKSADIPEDNSQPVKVIVGKQW